MNAPTTDWTSAVAILAGGLILGLLVIYFFSRRKAVLHDDVELKDLEAKRDALIAQLRGAEVEDREQLEREAARVMRAIDQRGGPGKQPATKSAAPRTGGMSPALQGVLWGTGSFLLLAGLAYMVTREAKPREQPMQQPPMAQQQTATAAPNPVVAQLEAAVQKDPDNLSLRNDLAQAYLETENMMGVFEQSRYVLAKKPDDSRALTFQGLVRLAMGEADAALDLLQRATKSDHTNLDAWVGLAWVDVQTGRTKEADAAIAEAIRISPDNKARLEDVLTQMKAQPVQPRQPVQTASGELPAGHPPIDSTGSPAAPTPPTPPASTDAKSIRVTIDLDPSARTRSGVLFVIARGASAGPPAAVKRINASSFPMTLDLSSADSMMGQPLPATVRIEARLDSDGDAFTKPPTDPAATLDGVVLGSSIHLALK